MGISYIDACRAGIGHLHPEHAGNERPAPVLTSAPATKRSKYRNQITIYRGVKYHSKAEAVRAEALDDLLRRGLIRFWLGQPKFRLGLPECVYVADFLVISQSGNFWAEDVKGVETSKFVRDKKLWAAYGPCPLRILRRGRVVETIERRSAS